MRLAITLLIVFAGLALTACAGDVRGDATQQPVEEDIPELAEIDAMLAELEEFEKELALSRELKELEPETE